MCSLDFFWKPFFTHFRTLRNGWQGYQNNVSRVHGDTLRINGVLKKMFFILFWALSEKFLLFRWQICGWVRLSLYVPKGSLSVKVNCFLKKKVIFSVIFMNLELKIFGFLSTSFQRGCGNCIVRVHRNILRKNVSPKLLFFFQFRILSETFLALVDKFPTCWSDQLSTCLSQHFEEKFPSIKKSLYTIFETSAKKFRPTGQNCFLRVHWTLFPEHQFSINFGLEG